MVGWEFGAMLQQITCNMERKRLDCMMQYRYTIIIGFSNTEVLFPLSPHFIGLGLLFSVPAAFSR